MQINLENSVICPETLNEFLVMSYGHKIRFNCHKMSKNWLKCASANSIKLYEGQAESPEYLSYNYRMLTLYLQSTRSSNKHLDISSTGKH